MAPRRGAAAPGVPLGIAPSVPRGLAVVRVVAAGARNVGPFAACVALQVLAPRPWPLLRLAAVLAHRGLRRLVADAANANGAGAAAALVALPAAVLEPLSSPSLFFLCVPPVLRVVAPPLVRTAVFYRHMLPVVVGYLQTLFLDAPEAARRGGNDAGQAVWDARHEWGAQRVYDMLAELRGFYPKVGQVFATKAELLPAAYPRKLRALFDSCEPAPFSRIRRTLEAELGAPLETLFAHVDPVPLATATIAQVHRGKLHDGRDVVVKVQHHGMERVMRSDITNMLRVCCFLEWAKLDLNFDQVSIMREYQEQVPLEFDFCREAQLVQRIGGALRTGQPAGRVLVPGLVPERSTRRVLCLEFMQGTPFSALQRAVDPARALEGPSSAPPLPPGAPQRALEGPSAAPLPPGASPREMDAMIRDLLESFGHQIFVQGVFHSDPHPGNLLRLPDGRVGLLDFGECKELSDETRLLFARLTVALAQRHPAAALPLLAECGVDIDGATPEFAMVAAYIMFDTRMDIPEAHMSPLDAGADEMRAVKVRKLPKELFMLLRVVTLIRGMLAIFKSDVSASKVWEPYALAALKKAGIQPPPPPPPAAVAASAKGGSAAEGTEAGGIYDKMYRLAEWMLKHDLPHDRKALMPCAMTGLTTLAEIAAADDERLAKGLKHFAPAQRERCRALAREAVAAEAAERAKAAVTSKAAAPAGAAPAKAASAGQEKMQRGFAKLRFARAIAAK